MPKATWPERETRRMGRLQYPAERDSYRRANCSGLGRQTGTTRPSASRVQEAQTAGQLEARNARLDLGRFKRGSLSKEKGIHSRRSLRPRRFTRPTPPKQRQHPAQNPPATPNPPRPRFSRFPRRRFVPSQLARPASLLFSFGFSVVSTANSRAIGPLLFRRATRVGGRAALFRRPRRQLPELPGHLLQHFHISPRHLKQLRDIRAWPTISFIARAEPIFSAPSASLGLAPLLRPPQMHFPRRRNRRHERRVHAPSHPHHLRQRLFQCPGHLRSPEVSRCEDEFLHAKFLERSFLQRYLRVAYLSPLERWAALFVSPFPSFRQPPAQNRHIPQPFSSGSPVAARLPSRRRIPSALSLASKPLHMSPSNFRFSPPLRRHHLTQGAGS